MQIDALNSISFQGRKGNRGNVARESAKVPNSAELEGEESGLTLEQKLDALDKVVEKANQNVHPSTIFYTVVTTAAAGLAATKFTKAGRKIVVAAGENLSKSAVKLFNNAKAAITKNPVDSEKLAATIKNIGDKATLLREGTDNSKFANGIVDFVRRATDDNKANALDGIMTKFNLKNGVGIFDALAGVIFATKVVDPASDMWEQDADQRQVYNALKLIAS